ncbi:PP2C family protein-serine/threonine phosphatase [Pseudomonas sp. SDO524_S393]
MSRSPRAWSSAGRTQRGRLRARNEDAFFDGPQHGCWAVADGMGGHLDGDVASQRVVASLAALPEQPSFDRRIEAVLHCLQRLNSCLSLDRADGTTGSTVVALLLEGARAACLWAGDSRCYLWRERCLYQLSRDHSLARQLMEQQHLSRQQAQAHANARALTRAVGAHASLRLEILELSTRPGDVFLLCSDGLYQGLSHAQLGAALEKGGPQQVLEHLFNRVLRGAAPDDLTAVVVQS